MKKNIIYFILVFLCPVLLTLAWWGLFSSPSLDIREEGKVRYVYLDSRGPYAKLQEKRNEVLYELKKQGILPGASITLLMTDPRTTEPDNLLARTGYIIDKETNLSPPLKYAELDPRKVLVATIKAHPLFAYGKAYGAILAYCQKNGFKLQLPTVEMYNKSILSVEMPFPIGKEEITS